MSKKVGWIGLLVGILGCASPQKASAPPSAAPDEPAQEISRLEKRVASLEKRIVHLESEVSAASEEGEFTTMTIDSVSWSDGSALVSRDKAPVRALECHVVEWKDFGKMLRFTRKADRNFSLEAEGHPAVSAIMAVGGLCTDDGRLRSVVLHVLSPLVANTSYHLIPSNKNEKYRWSVAADLVVAAPDEKR